MRAKPLMMEVSLVSAPGPKAVTAPPAPPKPAEPPKPKKKPVKKTLKKKAPEKPKQAKPPKTEAVAEEKLPVPSPVKSTAQPSNSQNSSAAPRTTASASKAPSNAAPYTEASVNTNYGFNPPPKYPAIAKRRGWQGTVRLRVSVSAEGYSEAVAIHSSSGFEALDESAVEAVKKWWFNPAKRGDTAVGVFQASCRCAKKAKQLGGCEPCCTSDEGGPLGVADQAEMPNHPKLHP
jgi:protein TonB